MKYQTIFLALLHEYYKGDQPIAHWIRDNLEVSRTTAYRIVKNEIPVTVDHMVILSLKVPGLGEAFAEASSIVPARLISFMNHQTEAEFQEVLRMLIKLFTHYKAQPNAMLHYSARDVILFHFLDSFELLNYKFNVWHPGNKEMVITPETLRLGKELFELYRTIPSREFWLKEAFDAQVKQLRVKLKLRQIDEKAGAGVYRQLQKKINETAQWAELGYKGPHGAAVEYRVSDYCTMLNGGMLTCDESRILMLGVDNARFMTVRSESWMTDHLISFNHSFDSAKPMNHHYPNEIEKFKAAFGEIEF